MPAGWWQQGDKTLRVAYPILSVVLGVLAGCGDGAITPEGKFLSEERLQSVTSGVTTREEVLEVFGTPSWVSTFDPRRWYYVGQYARSRAFLGEQVYRRQIVAVSFDGHGVLEQLEITGLEDGKDITPSGQVTPTPGTRLSIWQQLVGNIGRFPQ